LADDLHSERGSCEDLKSRLDNSARRLLAFFGRNRRERNFRYPFHASYPLNCCESVSLILSYLLEEKYGLPNVRVIRGSRPSGYEHHFWVMAGDWIYDLTAHQFDGHAPLIGVLAHELFLDEFPDWTLIEEREFVERDKVVGLYRSGVIPF
jgi:hypothetical protein